MILFIMTKNLYEFIYMEESKQGASEQSINESDETNDYYNALDEYFSLKNEYENKYKNKIIALTKRKISKQEKIKELNKFKTGRLCINCGNSGGTYFGITTQDDGSKEYVATCLAHTSGKSEQCGLDIRLKKGKVIKINDTEGDVLKNIEDIKMKIIVGKLSLLFELENESVALKEFDDLKTDLEKYYQQMTLIEEKYSENNTVKIINSKNEPEIISKKIYIKQLKQQLDKYIYKFKSIIRESTSEEDYKKKQYLKDAYSFSIETITPLIEKIRDIKYQTSFVETNEKNKTQFDPIIYTVVHKEISNENLEIFGDEYAIIENIK